MAVLHRPVTIVLERQLEDLDAARAQVDQQASRAWEALETVLADDPDPVPGSCTDRPKPSTPSPTDADRDDHTRDDDAWGISGLVDEGR